MPASPETASPETASSETSVQPQNADRFLTERLDINRATLAELDLLPNIGPKLAGRIIAFRDNEGPIRSLTHLTDIDGIGVRTAEAIEPYIRFE